MATTWLVALVYLAVSGYAQFTGPISDHVKLVNLEQEESLTRNSDSGYRIERTVLPHHYDIHLTPYFDTQDDRNFTFDGRTAITISTTENNIREVVLHALHLTIGTVTLVAEGEGANAPNLASTNGELDLKHEKLTIPLTTDLTPNTNYTLTITYIGQVHGDNYMQGFYRSWYRDEDGTVKWMGTTQFQPGFARAAFPCFDEPFFKAIFVITINRPTSFQPSISNMPIEEYGTSEPTGDIQRTFERFYPTPLTSSYLIAFIVSEYVPYIDSTPKPFEVYSRASARYQSAYAYEAGIELLDAMNTHTGVNYYEMADHIKLDQAAIPDFSAGAMENWGLMTYREALILNDDTLTSNAYKQRIANIMSHEIAHMWFGNLVTCDWWDDLWLNEGFARYYQYFLTHMVEDYYQYDIQFITDQVRTALFADSLPGVHALTHDAALVATPAQVWNMFSTISYNKGAAVIRMIEFFMGEAVYERGLNHYLTTHEFSTTRPWNLYDALDDVAREADSISRYGTTVATVMSSFVTKNGFPLITVTVNQATGFITVRQQRFFRYASTPPSDALYSVPLTFTSERVRNWDNTTADYVLHVRETTLTTRAEEPGWVVLNKKGIGYYRVNYDPDTWERIINTLSSAEDINQIHELNRALIVDDLFQLARASILSYTTILRYLRFLRFETSYPVWNNALQGFSYLQRRLAHDPEALAMLEEFMLENMETVINHVGYDLVPNESHLTILLRTAVLSTACNLNHEECRNQAATKFTAMTNNGVVVPANLRMWVYCSVLRRGLAGDFDFLWARFRTSNVYNEKIEIATILGCTTNQGKLREYLDHIFEDDIVSGIRNQDISTALSSAITGNENNTDVVFDWVKENYPKIEENFNGLNGVTSTVNAIAARLITREDINALEDWIYSNQDLAPIFNSVRAAVESARQTLLADEALMPTLLEALVPGTNEDDDGSAAGIAVSALLLTLSFIITIFQL